MSTLDKLAIGVAVLLAIGALAMLVLNQIRTAPWRWPWEKR